MSWGTRTYTSWMQILQHTQKKSRASWLLTGAITGAGLAATGLVEDRLSPMENTIVATIDGESIAVSHFTNYLEALQKDKGKPLPGPDKSHLLDRMIDEKLLLQHARHLSLTRTDSAVKKAIVDAVIENIISENRGVIPSDKELETFYARNLTYFSHAPLLSVQRMVFAGLRRRYTRNRRALR